MGFWVNDVCGGGFWGGIEGFFGLEPVSGHYCEFFVVDFAVAVGFGGVIEGGEGGRTSIGDASGDVKPYVVEVEGAGAVVAGFVFVAYADYDADDVVEVNVELGEVDVPLVPVGVVEVFEALAGVSSVEDLFAVAFVAVAELDPEGLCGCVAGPAVEGYRQGPDAGGGPVGA